MDLENANTTDDISVELLMTQPNENLKDLSPNSYRLLVNELKEDEKLSL
jgi:hypothetical protein